MDRTFIERTDPPGAELLHVGDAQLTPEVYVMDMGAIGVTGKTKTHARRRAWELWAYELLGDGLVWSHEEEVDPEIGQCHSIYLQKGGQRVTLSHWLDDHEWELEHEIVSSDHRGIPFSSFETDPVEALVRMAALCITVYGMPDGEKE